MKRLVSLLCMFCMVLAIPAHAVGVVAPESVRVAQIENVGSTSSNLKNQTLDQGANEIVDPDADYELLANGDLSFAGTVNNKAFNVSAVPYSTPANENVHVFEGSDLCNNYQVLYVAVEQNIADSAKYFNDVNCEAYAYMVKLYMRTNGTDDIVIVEIFSNDNSFYDLMNPAVTYSLTGSEDDEGKINQFWYAKVFTPEVTYTPGVSPLTMDSVTNEGTYTYVFDHLGLTYYQYFTLWRYIMWPDEFSNEETFQTALQVKEAYTEVPDFPNENSDSTYMRIDSARIDVAVDEGDAITYFTFDGETHKAATASVTLHFNTTVELYGPLELTFDYDDADPNFDLNTEDAQKLNGDEEWHRQLGAELESGHRLQTEGHYFSVRWEIANFSGAKTNQAFKVRFTYEMTNLLDYTHWTNGEKQFTDTVYYNTLG